MATSEEGTRYSANSMACASGSRGSKSPDALNVARAVFWHDVFNLAALAAVNSLNFWYLLYGKGSTLWQLVLPCRERVPALSHNIERLRAMRQHSPRASAPNGI